LEDAQVLHFDLYVVDNYPKADLTINNLKEICRRMHMKCSINRIDLAQNPSIAKEKGIVATPTIIRTTPLPEIRLVGTLKDYERATAFLSR
jgi:circadian clock protein KaiB